MGMYSKDQHWDFRLQTAPDEPDQIIMPDLELEGDLVHELAARPLMMAFTIAVYYGSFNRDFLVVLGCSHEHHAKCTFSDQSAVIVCDLLQLALCEDVDIHSFQYLAPVSVKKASP